MLPIFRTPLQAELLTRVFVTAPDGESISALARALDAVPATVHREVSRLERAGLLTSERVGNTRVVRADRDSPVHAELAALLGKAFGPAAKLEESLTGIAGIERAYIFGSWARRAHGEAGSLPRDVDLLVIGTPDPNEVYAAARSVEEQLGIEVNPVTVDETEWSSPRGFVARVRREPLVELAVGSADDR